MNFLIHKNHLEIIIQSYLSDCSWLGIWLRWDKCMKNQQSNFQESVATLKTLRVAGRYYDGSSAVGINWLRNMPIDRAL
jgi:hypothetical protein